MRRLETRLSSTLWLWLPPDSRDFPEETKASRRDGSLSSARRERLCSICVVALRLRTSVKRAKQVTTPSATLPSGHRFCRSEGVESQRKVERQRNELRRALSLRARRLTLATGVLPLPLLKRSILRARGRAGESGIEFSVSALEVWVWGRANRYSRLRRFRRQVSVRSHDRAQVRSDRPCRSRRDTLPDRHCPSLCWAGRERRGSLPLNDCEAGAVFSPQKSGNEGSVLSGGGRGGGGEGKKLASFHL